MFDHYEPVPKLGCPVCGGELVGWQGKDGPCGLFVWRQGEAAPVDQAVPDDIKGEETGGLPAEFEIYTECCGGRFFVTAWGRAPEGVWSETVLDTAGNIRQRKRETRAEFKQRRAWLEGKRTGG